MTHALIKTAKICALLTLIGTGQTMGQESGKNDLYNDGAAAAHGRALLELWLRNPATPGKIARVTPGKEYMAKRLKLEPGAHPLAEMALIAAAGSDKYARNVVMMHLRGERPMPREHASQGERSLAAGLGVDAREYSLSELAKMKFDKDF
ncbi:hypothetical protein [Litoreibacter arenae]|uniref:hypothetical protein n=1 Tax=Litoreibacter arenae TaxID=491388 RepID=UPI0005938EAD|nr:hypothetical protein [Litoreibacter arenae]